MADDAPSSLKRANRSLARQLWWFAAGSLAFGFALVPLYSVLCKVTGYGDKTALLRSAELPTSSRDDRLVTVEFISTNPTVGEWTLKPVLPSIQVHPGQLYEAVFEATNLVNKPVTAQAIPSIAPSQATQYFRKTDCFCFLPQAFAPTQTRELKVKFYVDSALPEGIDRITLAYAMFTAAGPTVAAR